MGKNKLARARENEARIPDLFRFVYENEIKGEWYRLGLTGVYQPNQRYKVIRVEFRDTTLDGNRKEE